MTIMFLMNPGKNVKHPHLCLILCFFLASATSALAELNAIISEPIESRGIVAIWKGHPNFPPSDGFQGTGFHIGNGTYVTAKHVLESIDGEWHIVVASKEALTNRVLPKGKPKCPDDVDICFFRVDPLEAVVQNLSLSEPFQFTCVLSDPLPLVSMRGFSKELPGLKIFPPIHVLGLEAQFETKNGDVYREMIETNAQTSPGLSGSPIVIDGTRKAIGVHSGFSKGTQNQAITPFFNIAANVNFSGRLVFSVEKCNTPDTTATQSPKSEDCVPVFQGDKLTAYHCPGKPDTVFSNLISEGQRSNLPEAEIFGRLEELSQQYDAVLSRYETLYAYLSSVQKDEVQSRLATGNLEEADQTLVSANRQIAIQRENFRATASETMGQLLEAGLKPGGVVARRMLWPNGSTLKVCFLDGTPSAHNSIAEVAVEWSYFGNIAFDFGFDLQGNARLCSSDDSSEIRISTQGRMNRAYIGRSALARKPGEPTVWLHNFGNKTIVLHEFGHVLGLQHTFQHPDFCRDAIDWEKAEEFYRRRYGWSSQVFHRVFREASSPSAISLGVFDGSSIMQYHLPAEIFIDESENCTSRPLELSLQDKLSMFVTYPFLKVE